MAETFLKIPCQTTNKFAMIAIFKSSVHILWIVVLK